MITSFLTAAGARLRHHNPSRALGPPTVQTVNRTVEEYGWNLRAGKGPNPYVFQLYGLVYGPDLAGRTGGRYDSVSHLTPTEGICDCGPAESRKRVNAGGGGSRRRFCRA